jgi:hypothetical protein
MILPLKRRRVVAPVSVSRPRLVRLRRGWGPTCKGDVLRGDSEAGHV